MRVNSTCPERPQPSAAHKFQETWFVNGDGVGDGDGDGMAGGGVILI